METFLKTMGALLILFYLPEIVAILAFIVIITIEGIFNFLEKIFKLK